MDGAVTIDVNRSDTASTPSPHSAVSFRPEMSAMGQSLKRLRLGDKAVQSPQDQGTRSEPPEANHPNAGVWMRKHDSIRIAQSNTCV